MTINGPVLRICVAIFGGLAVLGGSSGLTAAKVGYLLAYLLCLTVAATRVGRLLRDPAYAPFRGLIGASVLLSLWLVTVAPVVAFAHGHAVQDWLRDSVGYGLLATAPILGLDAGAGSSRRAAVRLTVIAGLLGAAGFAVAWLAQRGVSALSMDRFLLSTFAMAVVPFGYALSRAALGPARLRWLGYAALLPGLLLVTGTRTAVVFAAGFAGVVGSPRKARVSLFVSGALAIASVAATVTVVALLATSLVEDPTFLQRRLAEAQRFLAAEGTDYSYLERRRAYEYTLQVWTQWPLLGSGPGYRYPSVSLFGDQTTALSIDSPLLLPAKLGILGAALVLALLASLLLTTRRCAAQSGYTASHTAVRVAAVVLLALVPFGNVIEDKGLSFGLMLAVALLASAVTPTGVGGPERSTSVGASPTPKPRGSDSWRRTTG